MAKRSQVTTKRGDGGTTVTLAGDEYPKSHPLIECCGQLDSLRAWTALVRLEVLASKREDAGEIADFLLWVLHVYFLIGSHCNDPYNRHPEYRKDEVSSKHLRRLEEMQETLESGITLPKSFIVSASNELSARVDFACTLTRQLERDLVRLREAVPEFSAGHILAFANRLSDFLFVLARHLEDGQYVCVDYGVLEHPAE